MAVTRRFGRAFRVLLSSLALIGLGACGGGGGSSDPGFIGGGGDTDTGTNFRLSLSLTDSDGENTTNVTSVDPGTLTVTVTRGNNPVEGEVVSADTTIGVVKPDSGTALTDANGVATFRIEAGDALGAGVITVTAGDDSATFNFQVGEADLRVGSRDALGNFVEGVLASGIGDASLPPGGSTTITAVVVDDDGEGVDAVEVQFSSGCAVADPATAELTPSVITNNGGAATATYTAKGCIGSDTVTAAVVGGNTQQATTVLEIANAPASSISFLSAEPANIALKGTGGLGRQEFSNVQFQVFDTTGMAAQGVTVTFSLNTNVGGLTLTNADPATGEATAVSNAEGIASATVLAGNVATSVRVRAVIDSDGGELSTFSDQLLISTGLPDRDSFSVSVEKLNYTGGNVDGRVSSVNIRLADKFNNPVPDGTAVVFTTEYGAIGSGCATTGNPVEAGCSVDHVSQDPRLPLYDNVFPEQVKTIFNTACPSLLVEEVDPGTGDVALAPAFRACPDPLGDTFGRRSSVLVHAIGEETFVDLNANGFYDEGEPHGDLPEAFLDDNEDGVFSRADAYCDGMPVPASVAACSDNATDDYCVSGSEEIFVDFNSNGCYDSVTAVDPNGAGVSGMYNGTLCPVEGDGLYCSRDLVHVFDNATIVMSNDSFDYFLTRNGIGYNGSLRDGESYVLYIADVFNNRPASGAVVSVSAEGCDLGSAEAVTLSNSNAKGAFGLGISLLTPDNGEPATGIVTVQVTLPEGASPAPVVYGCSVGG
jgi:hypothetical protein